MAMLLSRKPFRIVLSCLQSSHRYDVPSYDFWRDYFVKGCEEAGIEYLEVPDVDWAKPLTSLSDEELGQWKAETWERTVAFVRSEHRRQQVDAFLGYLYPQHVDIGAVTDIQRLGVPCVNFFCDNIREFKRLPKEFAPFTAHWVPEFEALAMYRREGWIAIHAPMPCWVSGKYRQPPETESGGPTFIGAADPLRRTLLANAISAGADISIVGRGWNDAASSRAPERRSAVVTLKNQPDFVRRFGPSALARKVRQRLSPQPLPPDIPTEHLGLPVGADEYVRMTRESTMTIGINRVPTWFAPPDAPLRYSRLRDIEAPMLGACYLTERAPGLDRMYELGTEIETYADAEELAEKIGALTADVDRRRLLRRQGQRRALTDHTTAKSLNRVLHEVAGVAARPETARRH